MTPLPGAALDSLRGIVASDLGGRRVSLLSDAPLNYQDRKSVV